MSAMPPSDISNRQNWNRPFFAGVALLSAVVITAASLHSFRQISLTPSSALFDLACYASACFVPILFGWIGFKRTGAAIFFTFATGGVVLYSLVTKESTFALFPVSYAGLFFLVYWVSKKRSDETVIREIEIEKHNVEKNDLEMAFKEKGKSISVCFEKYSAYYNLRRLADEFSSTLELSRLGDIIVSRTLEFIQKGDWCLLFLASPEKDEISLIASKSTHSKPKTKKKLGDLFDHWVLRNRQHLLITDTQKDFRFDLKKTAVLEDVRSAILSPLMHEGKVAGTLRIDAMEPETFTTDHLRFLDAISTLASSALSNAMLYQRTEELAIRDSLTNLYVQRYFLERLKEEHKRALLMHEPLSLLIGDLDHFKKINDEHGHAVGDLVLRRVADVLKKFGEQGIVARYGGGEFTILLPHMTKAEAYQFAEKIRARVASERIEVRRKHIQETISIGVASVPDDTLDGEELIKQADARLYEAKRAGRNRVC